MGTRPGRRVGRGRGAVRGDRERDADGAGELRGGPPEREPITDANRDQALSGGDITEEEHEVILKEERPVVQKETVPVERVRVDKDTVTEEHQVDETVRKEARDRVRRPVEHGSHARLMHG